MPCACAWKLLSSQNSVKKPPGSGTAGCQINGSLSFRPWRRPLSRNRGHSWGCRLALIRASLVSWEVESVSLFGKELLPGKVTCLCAPGLSLTSFLWGSSDLCLPAPCTRPHYAGALPSSQALPAKGLGSPFCPAPPSGPRRPVHREEQTLPCGFSSSQLLYIETS